MRNCHPLYCKAIVMNELLAEINWRPAIGDPDPLGWTITVAYLAAGCFCVSAGRHANKQSGRGNIPWFWYGLAVMMFGLGLNKQLDLQVLLTQIGREVAKQGGWLQYRRLVQAVFVIAAAGIGVTFLVVANYLVRDHWREYGLAFCGAVMLVAFIVFRASYLNNVTRLMDRVPGMITWVNAGLELGGAFLVGLGALSNTRRSN